MDDDSSSPAEDSIAHIPWLRMTAPLVAGSVLAGAVMISAHAASQPALTDPVPAGWTGVMTILSPGALAVIAVLIGFSAFFSASEVAFFGIHQVRLRAMGASSRFTDRLVASMMAHPSRLLTTILVGNMIVNVLISVLLPNRVSRVFDEVLQLSPGLTFPLTALVCTGFLVYFGEITPKIVAVRICELFARLAALPLRAIDLALNPVCWVLMRFTDFVFRVTRFNDIKAAPFLTDEEFKSMLSRGETEGVLDEEEGEMIQGILELGDATLREILVPRPDVVAVPLNATVREALERFRENEFSRMPVLDGDLDHVTGLIVAKDLLPFATKGHFDEPIARVIRRTHFVPESMTIQAFVEHAQRAKTHLAVVVDEYGGTEGIVTLEDAVEEVVGEIHDESDAQDVAYREVADNTFEIDGDIPLDDLSDLIGVSIRDDEHETIAGFLMAQTSKVLEAGDTVEYNGASFYVQEMEGKRAAKLQVKLIDEAGEESA